MTDPDLSFACQCGTVKGRLSAASPKIGTHIDCACADCRDAAGWLGHPPDGPVALFQTTPDRLHFDSGAERLAVFTWRNKRLLRWYASCCNAPICNTGPSPKMAFVSLVVDRVADIAPLGPVRAHAFIDKGNGRQGHTGMAYVVLGLLTRSVPALLNGAWKETPFFDPQTGAPMAPLRHLEARDRAVPLTKP